MSTDAPLMQGKTTGVLFRELLDRKAVKIGSQVPWSIAELQLSEGYIELLHLWLQQDARDSLPKAAATWSRTIDPSGVHTNDVVCGLVLHALYAAHVRRFGSEGSYWGSVTKLDWPSSLRSQWMTEGGQPTALHRRVLEQAAQTLRLRNAFGIEGTFQWFGTGFLQFGFTHRGFLARLPEWLSSRHLATNGISALLDDANLQSETFHHLWQTLKSYRHGNLNKAVTRERLKNSPWVLDVWIDDLLKVSRKRLHLVINCEDEDEGDFFHHYLSEPQLRFHQDGAPLFITQLTGVADLDLTADSYHLTFDDEKVGSLIRQSDGGYAPTTNDDLTIPWANQSITSHLESATDGTIAASQVLACWQAEEVVQVFKEDGTRYRDPTHLRTAPQRPIRLLFPTSLDLEEANVLQDWICPNQRWRIALVEPSPPLALKYQGQVFWSLADASANTVAANIDTTGIRLWCDPPVEQNSTTQLHLSLPQDVELRWARIGLETIDLAPQGGQIEIPFIPQHLDTGLVIHLGLSHQGRAFRHRVRTDVPFQGVLWFLNGKYKRGPAKIINARQAAGARLRVIPQALNNAAPQDFAVLEGHRLGRRLSGKAFCPGPMTGLGAPLQVRRGPFNDANEPLLLAKAIVDGGLIRQIRINEETITIFPSEGLELRDDLTWVAWVHGREQGRRLEVLHPQKVPSESGRHLIWVTPNSFNDENINAIAAFLDGRRVGSWWNLHRWTHTLNGVESEEEARGCLRISRLFKCPILFEDTLHWVRGFVQRYPAVALTEWLNPRVEVDLPNGGVICNGDEPNQDWRRAVGEVCERADLNLDLQMISEVMESVRPDFDLNDLEPSFIGLVSEMSSISPAIAAEITVIWLREFAAPALGGDQATTLLRALGPALKPHEDQIEDFCANVARADRNFIDTHLRAFATSWPHLPPLQALNLQLLFQYDVFRRLATVARICHLIQLPT